MRKIIEFTGEAFIASPKIKKEKAPKIIDNSRKINSLQKQIEKMKSSWLWNMPYTHRRQRQLDSYSYRIERLEKQIIELWWESSTNFEALKLDQKIKWQLLKKIPWYFPTPKNIVDRMVELADIQPMDYILEPSCWTGDIIDGILEKTTEVNIKWIEYNYSNYEILLEKYKSKDCVRLENIDFMTYTNDSIFSKIIMNPPFENKQDMKHIMKAFDLLNEWWILVSIASSSVLFRNDYQKFRDFIDSYWYYEKLEEWSFKLSWTMTNTILIYLKK